ncbi:universal stress protein [Streptomyces sp. NPDC048643]|uniref:universal stress protein n=1 Tax=Streptomyces sp. NPDC048643 TaxID=3155637 RepID=UPI00343C2F32
MNPGTRTITVGIDGSRASLDAADWAAREAGRRRLPLRLLHASPRPHVPVRVPDVEVPAGRTRSPLDRAAIQLSYAHPALDIDARGAERAAVPALIEAAAASQTLVLGSRGHTDHTGVAGFPAGSVALAVAAGAERPVVLVPAGELPEDERVPVPAGASPSAAAYRPVVLGLDLTRPADELIGHAFDTAAVRGAPLHVVHAWTLLARDGDPSAVPPGDAADEEDARRHALTGALGPWCRRFPGTPVAEQVVHGRVGHHLLSACTGAGLLVVGRRAGERLGRAVQTLIHQVTCPVVVVPHA